MEITIKNLCKNYEVDGKVFAALDHIDLTIPANRIFTLLGPSGCGKTTLLRCIVGLETPDEGEIVIGDETVFSSSRGLSVATEKRGLGMVFQSYAIWPHMSVFENVAYPLQTRKIPTEEIVGRVEKTLHFVQLDGFGGRPATKLSGGQQQRVALARALVAEPKVILFDEPLSNLDAKLREDTRKELRRFLTELAITAVYVTHDRLEALSLSDRVAVMKSGKIIESGSPWEIYFDSDRRFVADFIGRVNFIEGTIAEGGGDFTLVHSAIGQIACERKRDYSPGIKATVGIRPEFIQTFRDDPGEGENTFCGRIETLVFLGDVWEAETQVGDATLVVRIDPALPVSAGDAIFLRMDRRYCSILLN